MVTRINIFERDSLRVRRNLAVVNRGEDVLPCDRFAGD